MIESGGRDAVSPPAMHRRGGGSDQLRDGASAAQAINDHVSVGEHVAIHAIIGSYSQAKSCDNRDCDNRKWRLNSAMDPYEKLAPETADVFRRLDESGLKQRDLADALNLEPNKISKIRSGERQLKAAELLKARDWLRTIRADRVAANVVTASRTEASANYKPDLLPTVGASDGDGAIALKRINIGFAMGDGSNLDDYVEEGSMDFDANLLRLISSSPAHRLVVADGIGDSMQPTLMDSDLIVIDTLQNQLNKWDRIWALSLQGAGAVKRLGPAERGKVEIISDNPAIPNRVVPMEDVRIIGRVVWSSRRH